jgi:hypothetical protein
MSEIIDLNKTVFRKNSFDKLVDKNFKSLVPPPASNTEFTITDFFELYESLFFQIPKEGDIESHRYILNKTASYLGVPVGDEIDIQALLNEITSLRQELLDANKTLVNLNKK